MSGAIRNELITYPVTEKLITHECHFLQSLSILSNLPLTEIGTGHAQMGSCYWAMGYTVGTDY